MRAIGKGVLVLLITIVLAAILLPQARAGTERELKQLLEGKTDLYRSTCHLNEHGLFRDKEEKYTVHRCIISTDMSVPDEVYYVLILDQQSKPVKLILVDKDATPVKQEVLWTNARTT